MSIANIFKISYYFNTFPDATFKLLLPLVILLGVILVITIILHWRFNKMAKKLSGDKKFFWAHFLNMGYTFSLVNLAHLWFRYETIPYMNWRIWPALTLLGIIGWLGYLAYYRYKLLPKKHVERESRKSLAYYFRRRRKN